MTVKVEKKVLIIAGPNGAGKTTFAREFLPAEARCPVFINADLIAAGLSPFAPERAAVLAGRLMLRQIEDEVRRGESFAFETTLAGRAYARRIPTWQKRGYRVKMIFLKLPNVEMAIERVGHGWRREATTSLRPRYAGGLRRAGGISGIVTALCSTRGRSSTILAMS